MLKGLLNMKNKRPELETRKLWKEKISLKKQIYSKGSKSTAYKASRKVKRGK